MKFGEHAARKIVLAQAIEMADLQGKLLSEVEREEIDLRAGNAARAIAGTHGVVDIPKAIFQRAELVIKAVAERNAYLASLQDKSAWWNLVTIGMPLAALVLGIASDHIGNPHRVNLLSTPLLIVLLWNVAVYFGLLLSLPLSFLRQRSDTVSNRLRVYLYKLVSNLERHRIRGFVKAEAVAQFYLRWQTVSNSLGIQRITQMLHFSAAAWGAGIAISLVWRGINAEYHAGWESTWLTAEQVHSVLSFIFTPVTFFFSEPFTLQDIRSLQFSSGAASAVEHGRRWGSLYVGLLLMVVVLPRLLLAAFAAWRIHLLSQQVTINLNDTYYEKLIDRICPARITLGIFAQDISVLSELKRTLILDAVGVDSVLISTPNGDSLRLISMLSQSASVSKASTAQQTNAPSLAALTLNPFSREHDYDVVLHVVATIDQLEDALPRLSDVRKPVLILVRGKTESEQSAIVAQAQLLKKHHDLIVDVLSIDAICACWVQEAKFFEALSHCVPRSKVTGLNRLEVAWDLRNRRRFSESMSLLSLWLIELGSEVENVRSSEKSLKLLFSSKLRAENRQAELAAETKFVERLSQREYAATQAVFRLHGIDESEARLLEKEIFEKFDINWTLDPPEAGLVGVASGAAVGAAIDLMAVGMTVGVGLLVGSLVGGLLGGGTGYFGARFKNRGAIGGGNSMQLSDVMLPKLVELALIRYLTACHHGRLYSIGSADVHVLWRDKVAELVQEKKDSLLKSWSDSRLPKDGDLAKLAFTAEMETLTLAVLRELYPDHFMRVP